MKSLFFTLLGAVAGVALYALNVEEQNAQTFAALEERAAQVGAACEPVYAAAWVDYECPLFGSKMPLAVKPVVCTPSIRVFRAAKVEDVRRKVQERVAPGAPALFLEEKGVKERELPVLWDARIGK